MATILSRVLDLLRRHNFEVPIAAVLIVWGIVTAIDPATTPKSISSLLTWLVIAYLVAAVTGGTLTLIGAMGRRHWWWASGVERSGQWLCAVAWAIYAVGLLIGSTNPQALLATLAFAALAWSHIVQASAIAAQDRSSLEAMRRAADRYGRS